MKVSTARKKKVGNRRPLVGEGAPRAEKRAAQPRFYPAELKLVGWWGRGRT